MIKINIQTNGDKILDNFDHKKVTLLEVGVTLLRLKQIEKKLIDMEFDSEMELRENY